MSSIVWGSRCSASSRLSFFTQSQSIVWADHSCLSWFGRVCWRCMLRCWTSISFNLKLFFRVFRHPKACLDPLLFGNLTHHTKLFIFHVNDGLCVCLLTLTQPLHPLTLLCTLGLSNAHFNAIELFNMLHNVILLFTRFTDLQAACLYLVKLSLSHQLLALLDQVLRDAVLAE